MERELSGSQGLTEFQNVIHLGSYSLFQGLILCLKEMVILIEQFLCFRQALCIYYLFFYSSDLFSNIFFYTKIKRKRYLHTATINTIDQETGNARKVSKRKDAWADSRWFHEKGYPKEAILEYLINITK